MKRHITKRQEQAFRLVHPSFGGLSHKQAAAKMGITVDAVYKLLQQIRKTAPQLFPILSAKHAEIWQLYNDKGLDCREIASLKDTTERSIQDKLYLIKKKVGNQTQQRLTFSIDHIDETRIVQNF